MNRFQTIAITGVACLPLLLGGCSTFKNHPTPVASNIPEAGSMDPKQAQTLYLTIVGGLRDNGQSRAALAYLDEFDRKFPDIPYAKLLRAQCLMDVGRSVDAEPVFASLTSGEYAAAAQAGLGSVAASHDDWAHAVGSFREANRLEPAQAQYANDLGFAQVRQGDYGSGIDMLGRAAELAPDNRFIRNNLILSLHLSGQNQEAARLIDGIADANERQQAKKLLSVSAGALATQTALHSDAKATAPAAKKEAANAPKTDLDKAFDPTKATNKEIKS